MREVGGGARIALASGNQVVLRFHPEPPVGDGSFQIDVLTGSEPQALYGAFRGLATDRQVELRFGRGQAKPWGDGQIKRPRFR